MYSWGHKTLDAAKDPEYWQWSWGSMGLYDDVANITAVKKATGEDKIFYLGYSQGTAQMHYGLSHLESSFYAKNLHKVVHLAPCFVPDVPNWTKLYANKTIMQLPSLGVYAFNGPNWDADLKTICDNFKGKFCDYFTNLTGS